MAAHGWDGGEAAGPATEVAPALGAAVAAVARPPAWPPAPGTMLVDRYQVDAVLGKGGSGFVLRGRDLATGELVAIKAVMPGAIDEAAALREASILARLEHPGIVRHLAHGRVAHGGAYLVLELLVGETLRERLQSAPLTPREGCLLAARLLRALDHAHVRGIVHRDVKPANVILVGGSLEQPKLIDFGVALSEQTLTARVAAVAGTPVYMAPEQARGEPDLDGRVDVFAVGCLLVECLSGQPLFQGAGLAPFAKLALSDRIASEGGLDELPAAIAAIAARMLASDRARRPDDAGALANELEALVAGLAPVPPTAPAPVALGTREARPLVVLLLGPAVDGRSASDDAAERDVIDAARLWGGEAQRLPSSASLVTFGVATGARDQAIRAARAALELRRRFPGRAMAITLARATLNRRALVGPALDEGSRVLGTAAHIAVDGETAALLGGRFELAGDASAGTLRLEREVAGAESARTLLGRPVPFAGRAKELEALLAQARACMASSRAAIAIATAPAGGGKSRLRHETLDRLARDGAGPFVISGGADALRAGAPYALLASAVRALAGLDVRPAGGRAGAAAAQRIAALVDDVAPALPPIDRRRIATFLAELAGVHGSDRHDPALRAARRDGRVMADQIRIAFVDWLGHALARGPVVLTLDDLHWGDAPSFALVAAAVREHAGRPLVVLGFARPELDERYPGLWGELAPTRVALDPLVEADAVALARAVVPDLSPDRIASLVARAAGNPFFLEELLRHAVERASRGDDDGQVDAPATVLAAVQARLDRVGDGGRRVLRAASVFGETFSTAGLEALLDAVTARRARSWLEDLARRDLVVRASSSAADGRWAFRHALVRDAAYDALTESDRRIGHRLAAGYLEREGERGLVLATHFERAADLPAARAQLCIAAEDAVRANDFDGAVEHCRRAERLGADGQELGRLRLAEARAQVWRSAWTDVLRCSLEAEPLLAGDEAFAATEHVLVAREQLGHTEELRDAHRALVACKPGDGPIVAWAIAALRNTPGLSFRGFTDDVEALLASLADAAAHPDVIAFRESARGSLALVRGKTAEAAEAFARAQLAFERAGDVRESCVNLNNLVSVLVELGRMRDAATRGAELVRLCRRIDHRFVLTYALVNLATAQLMLGELVAARASLDEALALAAAAEQPRVEGYGQLLLAQLALCERRSVDAVGHATAALAKIGDMPGLACVADAALARGLLACGDAEQARARAQAALTALRSLGGAEHGELTVWLAAIEASRAIDDRSAAVGLAREAVTALERRLGPLSAADKRALLASTFEVTALAAHARALDVAFPEPPTKAL